MSPCTGTKQTVNQLRVQKASTQEELNENLHEQVTQEQKKKFAVYSWTHGYRYLKFWKKKPMPNYLDLHATHFTTWNM
ncbi:hypothetical protein BaRGS_00000858 [Batillaria attramentaria]|uniref:Uncharacterized protein n=1 Tax=Batillaria attramentaria TaxID=370345 RepID=A0ABD0M7V9_9CAEN